MNNTLRKVAVAFFAAATAIGAYAIPARPGAHAHKCSNGSTVNIVTHGDENFHYYTTEDGYLLMMVDNDPYYAIVDNMQVKSSGVKAVDIDRRSAADMTLLKSIDTPRAIDLYIAQEARIARDEIAMTAQGPGLFPGTIFPSTGSPRGIAVLVEYQDVKFTVDNPNEFYTRMLNEEGFSDYGNSGSAADWYHKASSGQFTPQFDVYGPITLAFNREYYGGNSPTKDKNAQEMAFEACLQLDESVDFNLYDNDNNGTIDFIFVYYAGKGENGDGPAESVWPKAASFTGVPASFTFDGLKLSRYACTCEWYGTEPDGMGTFCHEFSHVLGLPDVYATSYTSAFTPGKWDIMDAGAYNNNCHTPATLSSFERYALGWIDPKVIDSPADCELHNLVETNEAYVINTANENEYFILENRQNTEWDQYLPGHGMLIWHIDYDKSVWNYNQCNNNATHQRIDLEEADNKKTSSTLTGDPFPGKANVTSFTDDTTPSMLPWKGTPLDLPITEIEENNGVITFKVKGGASGIESIALDNPVKVTTDGLTISVAAPAGTPISVTDLAGRTVARGTATTADTSLTLPQAGLYIVRAGAGATKVCVK